MTFRTKYWVGAIALWASVSGVFACSNETPGEPSNSFERVDGLVVDEELVEDTVSGQWGSVRFKTVAFQGGESARARFDASGVDDSLYVHVSGRDSAEIIWQGQTIDGFGSLTIEERDTLRALADGPFGEALAMIPLDLGCAQQQYELANMQALLFAWQLQLKYLEESPAETAERISAASRCEYFPSVAPLEQDGEQTGGQGGETPDDTVTRPPATMLLLSRETPFPAIFDYFPLDEEGAEQTAVESDEAATRSSGLTVCDFGPNNAGCRGSCGADCTSNNCTKTRSLEQLCGEAVVVTKYNCGVHNGCIVHDHCYDTCNRDAPTDLGAALCRHLICDPGAAAEHGICTSQDWSNGYGPHSYRVDFYYHRRCGEDPCIDQELERRFGPPGDSSGDPHLTTIDGLAYDFQAAGEFVLLEAVDGEEFVVQARQEPVGSEACPGTVAINTAAAMKVADKRLAFYAGREYPLYIDGAPTHLGSGTLPLGQDAVISQQGSLYTISWPSGELVTVQVASRNLNLRLDVPEARQGDYRGLLGTYDDDTSNDIALRDGTVLDSPVLWDDLRGRFADSWRVTPESSLFDYGPSETTDTFTNLEFPTRPASVDALPLAQRQSAEQICSDAGVTDEILLEQCTLDVVCTGDAGYANQHAERTPPSQRLEVVEPIFLDGWTQQGEPSAGTWEVSDDGRSVRQTTNGDPTFFVSTRDYFETRIRGTFEVDASSDDDYIGFVFGYRSPLESQGDVFNDYDAFVLSWKQGTQSGADAGLTLAYANGVVDDIDATFWSQVGTASYTVLATEYGDDRGWLDNTQHSFELAYSADKIQIWIDDELIFDLTPANAGVSFEPGRFGFYNYSQAHVVYSEFMEEAVDTP